MMSLTMLLCVLALALAAGTAPPSSIVPLSTDRSQLQARGRGVPPLCKGWPARDSAFLDTNYTVRSTPSMHVDYARLIPFE